MMKELIKLTEETVTFIADRQIDVGLKIELEIKLPEGLPIKSFLLHGIITDCKFVGEKGARGYLSEMKICDISPLNQKILSAYIEFLKRDRILKGVRRDFNKLQESLTNLKNKFAQLAAVVELMTHKVEGALELIKRNNSGKITLH